MRARLSTGAASSRGPSRLAVVSAVVGSALLWPFAGSRAETLEEAWRIAVERDLSLVAAGKRVEAAEADFDAARADRRPALAASANALGFDDTPAFDFAGAGLPVTLPLFAGSSVLMADARMTLPLYTSGATRHAIGAAAADVTAETHRAAALTRQVRLDVAARYIDVLRAGSAAAVAEGNVSSLAAHLREVEDMYRGGSVPRNDFLAAAVSLADAEQRLLQARNGLDAARAAYNRALGRRLTEPVGLEPALPDVDERLETSSLDGLTALAVEQREELRSLEAAADALEARADSAAAATRPQLALTGGYTFLENDVLSREDYWTLGIGVQWNAFDSGRSRSRSRALSLRSAAVRDERRDLESLIALDVRRAWLERDATRQRVEVAEGAVEQAEENLRVVRDRYRNGEGTNTEVLDAEALRLQSLSNYDNARYDAALARYRLARAVGLL
ncbi:MAG: TolC family protein [Gammaproteobacteria bacterium]|nr:TolC family protein [Gammaproteobacteria bacterium]